MHDDEDTLEILTRGVRKRFRQASIVETHDGELAIDAVAAVVPDAAIVCCALDLPGVEIIRRLRAANPRLPLIFVDGRQQCAEAIHAGANRFHPLNSWQTIGDAVAELLDHRAES